MFFPKYIIGCEVPNVNHIHTSADIISIEVVRLTVRSHFANNAVVLSSVSLLVRFVSMMINVSLSGTMGAEGLGLYQLILSVYVLACGLPTSGVCVAVSTLTAEERASGRDENAVMRLCLCTAFVLAVLSSLLMVSFSSLIASYWLHDTRVLSGIKMITAAIPFMSLSNCARSWYTARENVVIPAISQMTEQAARFLVCLLAVPEYAAKGIEHACFGAVLSDVAGEICGCLIILFIYLSRKKTKSTHIPHNSVKRLCGICVPITSSFYLSSILRSAESALVPSCLISFGLSRKEALSQFGILHSMALTLLFFPAAFLVSVGSLILPKAAYHHALGDSANVRRCAEKFIRLSFCFSVPVCVLFMVYAPELSDLFYSEPKLIRMLYVLAPMVPMMYAETVCTAILRGIGEQSALLRYSVIDSVIRLGLISVLVPRAGMDGMMAVMTVSNILTPLLCMRKIKKLTGASVFFSEPLYACIFPAAVLVVLKGLLLRKLPYILSLLLGALLFIAVYAAAIMPGCKQKLREAVRRVGCRNRSISQYNACHQGRADNQAVRPVLRIRSLRRNRCTNTSRRQA